MLFQSLADSSLQLMDYNLCRKKWGAYLLVWLFIISSKHEIIHNKVKCVSLKREKFRLSLPGCRRSLRSHEWTCRALTTKINDILNKALSGFDFYGVDTGRSSFVEARSEFVCMRSVIFMAHCKLHGVFECLVWLNLLKPHFFSQSLSLSLLLFSFSVQLLLFSINLLTQLNFTSGTISVD